MSWNEKLVEEKWQKILDRNVDLWRHPERQIYETSPLADWWERVVKANAALGSSVRLEELRFGNVIWSLGGDSLVWDRVSLIRVGKRLYVALDTSKKSMVMFGSRSDGYNRIKPVSGHDVNTDKAIDLLLRNLVKRKSPTKGLVNIRRQNRIFQLTFLGIFIAGWYAVHRHGWVPMDVVDVLQWGWEQLASYTAAAWDRFWEK